MGQGRSRTLKWLVISLVVSVMLTAVLWQFIGPLALAGFLFLPFGLGGGLRGQAGAGADSDLGTLTCPQCGHQTMDRRMPYCPRDGSRLL